MKKCLIFILCLLSVGCNKQETKKIAYVEQNNDKKIICILNRQDTTLGYNLEEIQEFIYNDYLKYVNLKLKLEILNENAKMKLSSILDNYKNMEKIINNDENNLYSGINMNVYFDNKNLEISMYYDINSLNREYIENIEFKNYINENYIFDVVKYKFEQENIGNKCNIYLQ